MFRLACALLSVPLLAGCAISQPLAFGETATVAQKNQVVVTAGGGVTVNHEKTLIDHPPAVQLWEAATGARVRVGLGHRMEVGGEALVAWVNSDDQFHTQPAFVSGKAAWKIAPLDWMALIVGLGGAFTTSGSGDSGVLGTDLGLVFSHRFGLVEPYAGVRGALRLVPTCCGPMLVGAAGLSLHLGERVALLLEAAIPAWSDSSGWYWEYAGGLALSFTIGP